MEQKMSKTYFSYDCGNKNCEWKDSCNKLKWVWGMETNKISKKEKLSDYCRFKKILSQAFYDALKDQ